LPIELKSAEPGLSFTTTNSANQGQISVWSATTDGSAIVLAAFSKANNCWYLINVPHGLTGVVATPSPFTSATASGAGNGTSGTLTAASTISFPSNTAGTIYAEVKGDSNSADCSALAPVYNGSSYEWSTTGFPSL
jgi:hypothetical protein